MSFRQLAADYLDDLAQRHPDQATELGDHRFDALLPPVTAADLAGEHAALDAFGARLTAIDSDALAPQDRVDAAMLGNHISQRLLELDALREYAWNPLEANPGRSVYLLLAREFAPVEERLACVAARLEQVPAFLAASRQLAGDMPNVHVETAIGQFDGTITMLGTVIDAVLQKAPAERGRMDAARTAAVAALREHIGWLRSRLGGDASPRLGQERFARKLSLALNTAADSDAILTRAEADLTRVTEQITELASDLGGTPREVLDRLAADVPDEATILRFAGAALAAQTEYVRDAGFVTVYDDPVEIIEMPEIDRGVAVAYCDAPGPLEAVPLPTFLAVSPAPADWPPERVASFYREYNRHLLHNLMIHEAMPGHCLQLQHSKRFPGASTRLRAALRSGSFVEGWATYAEQLMAEHGYPGEGDPRTVRMQQLKMQLRMTINAILDARVHTRGMTEAEAMTLMLERGFQEEGEAAGKWRRTLLTSTQLSTYYVGYTEVSDLSADLRASGLTERQAHDSMLAHGCPPATLLRTLLLPAT